MCLQLASNVGEISVSSVCSCSSSAWLRAKTLQRTAAPGGRSDGSDHLSATLTLAADRAFPAAVAELSDVRPLHHAMRLPILFAVMVGAAVSGTSCQHAPTTQGKSDWLYLGIPVDEEYPGTKFHLDGYVPQDKY